MIERSAPTYDVTVSCDRCGVTDADTQIELTCRVAARTFRGRGWCTRQRKWLCPACRDLVSAEKAS